MLGIDPGTRRTGYGIIRDAPERVIAQGVIHLKEKTPLEERLRLLHQEAVRLIKDHRPDAIAVEQPFVGKGRGSSIAIGQAQAVIMLSAASYGVPVWKYSPSEVKLAVTGHGHATKEQVMQMTRVLLKEDVQEEDAADALAAALCHLDKQRAKVALGPENPGIGQLADTVELGPDPRAPKKRAGLL